MLRLICPACRAGVLQQDGQQWDCSRCASRFSPIADGIPDFLVATDNASCMQAYEYRAATQTVPSKAVGYMLPYFQSTMKKLFLKRLAVEEPKRPLRILDSGCGNGVFSEDLTKENQVFGVDFSPNMLRQARRRGIMVYRADVTRLPFDDNQFDVVISIEVIQHVASPDKMLRELSRVLRPGGLFVLSFPNREAAIRVVSRAWFNRKQRPAFSPKPMHRAWSNMAERLAVLPLLPVCIGKLYFPVNLSWVTNRVNWIDRFLASNFCGFMRKTDPFNGRS